MFDTHVYLGPSLDKKTAQHLLPDAQYHPPIKCGDLIRLLRLSPRRVMIIDGFYESVPAAWHKEILLTMQLGVEVIGAASLGALRAAELHLFGMHGIGQIYQDFKTGILTDDDEVAVLHRDRQGDFLPINDAMVNIRSTCQEALKQNIISIEMHDRLLHLSKTQFYPYRSIVNTTKQLLNEYPTMGQMFLEWLSENGLVDVKKADAIAALKHCATYPPRAPQTLDYKTPMTMFLRNSTYYANLTPFEEDFAHYSKTEAALRSLYLTSIHEYRLIGELAHLSRCLFSLAREETTRIEQEPLITYIKEHGLYLPQQDFVQFEALNPFPAIQALIYQSICLGHITEKKIAAYLPIIAHYYELNRELTAANAVILRILLVILFSIDIQMEAAQIYLSTKALNQQLKGLFIRRAYNKHQCEIWLHPTHIDENLFFEFLRCYFKIVTAYFSESSDSTYYFKWIHDAYHIYKATINACLPAG